MKKILVGLALWAVAQSSFAQDTFSIVALDTITGEIGSAGASCVDLDVVFKSLPNDFLSELIPGVGGINTQAAYDTVNQKNARLKMLEGLSPDSIIQYLVKNDAKKSPATRQYGIVAFVNGKAESAGYTGSSAFNYKEHRLGPNYSIQGNILLGKEIIDSMEYRFNNTTGSLACKLMAAMQGANVVGADTRCAPNNSSSLFAFIKVTQPTDTFGKPSFSLSVRTSNGDSIEPIDSLQTLFDEKIASSSCKTVGIQKYSLLNFELYPNPTKESVTVKLPKSENYSVEIYDLSGRTRFISLASPKQIETSTLESGIYILKVLQGKQLGYRKLIIN
jgi:uncharacterized Ntn-hydrolase superfamily protein